MMGAPLAVLATPAVVLVAGLSLEFIPGCETAAQNLDRLVGSISESISLAFDERNSWRILHPRVLAALYLLLLPGMMFLLASWFAFRARFREAGAGGLAASLGARPPRQDDVEEIQMGNVVEEMTIAAGSPEMKLFVLDHEAANAAVLGASENDAVMLVSRGLLRNLDRDETQAVAGHLIGSVASGDLRVLSSLNAVFQSVGFLLLLVDAAFALSPSAAKDAARTLRFVLGFTRDPAEGAAIEEILVGRLLDLRADGLHGLASDLQKEKPETSIGRRIKHLPPLYVLLVPFLLLYALSLLLRWQVWLLRLLLVGPMVMWVWRSRRHLADAGAVQLTRNPDALSRALERLSLEGELLSKAGWAEPLFVVGASRGEWSKELGGIVGSHPPLAKRLQRIAAMGGVDLTGKPRRSGTPATLTLGALVASPLLLTIASLFFLIAVASMALATAPAIALTLLGLELVRALL
jgi:Zn-dependent protease with chaperone function